MKKLIIVSMLLMGCSGLGNVKSTVVWEDGSVVEVNSKSDAIVTAKKGDDEIMVDNRGRPSFIETVLGAFLLRGK